MVTSKKTQEVVDRWASKTSQLQAKLGSLHGEIAEKKKALGRAMLESGSMEKLGGGLAALEEQAEIVKSAIEASEAEWDKAKIEHRYAVINEANDLYTTLIEEIKEKSGVYARGLESMLDLAVELNDLAVRVITLQAEYGLQHREIEFGQEKLLPVAGFIVDAFRQIDMYYPQTYSRLGVRSSAELSDKVNSQKQRPYTPAIAKKV